MEEAGRAITDYLHNLTPLEEKGQGKSGIKVQFQESFGEDCWKSLSQCWPSESHIHRNEPALVFLLLLVTG